MVPILPQPSTAIFFCALAFTELAVSVCVMDEVVITNSFRYPIMPKNKSPLPFAGATGLDMSADLIFMET
jgi:hypothetical protein